MFKVVLSFLLFRLTRLFLELILALSRMQCHMHACVFIYLLMFFYFNNLKFLILMK